eukprot:2816631-Prymnesium_polylepis.2
MALRRHLLSTVQKPAERVATFAPQASSMLNIEVPTTNHSACPSAVATLKSEHGIFVNSCFSLDDAHGGVPNYFRLSALACKPTLLLDTAHTGLRYKQDTLPLRAVDLPLERFLRLCAPRRARAAAAWEDGSRSGVISATWAAKLQGAGCACAGWWMDVRKWLSPSGGSTWHGGAAGRPGQGGRLNVYKGVAGVAHTHRVLGGSTEGCGGDDRITVTAVGMYGRAIWCRAAAGAPGPGRRGARWELNLRFC